MDRRNRWHIRFLSYRFQQKNITLTYTQNFAFGPTLSQFLPESYATSAYAFGKFDTYNTQYNFATVVTSSVGFLGLDPTALNLGA